MKENPFYIITGAPSTGKTSVLNELESRGYLCHNEIARQVIRENLDNGLDIFPWNQMRLFSDMVLERMRSLVGGLNRSEVQFLDRSMVDLIGYMNFAGKEAPTHYVEEAMKVGYSRKVFYLPLWSEIYVNDEERKENIEEAKKIAEGLYSAYEKLGFEIVSVPFGSVSERVDFILLSCGLAATAKLDFIPKN